MAVRKFNPVTPGQRHKVIGTFEEITASVPEKSLVYGKRSTGGRNNTGKMTVRYMGGGHKRKYRLIDFKREKDGVPAVVKTIEYDPNRSARIALLFYADGEKRYIIAPNGLQVGATLMSGADGWPDGWRPCDNTKSPGVKGYSRAEPAYHQGLCCWMQRFNCFN